ncbi:MAG: sulfotransferase domain-containing protein [Phycisphaerales bacterium]
MPRPLHKLFRFGRGAPVAVEPPPVPPEPQLAFNCDGREVLIPDLPPGEADLPSSLIFSAHKAGSTLLQQLLTNLAPHAGVTMFRLESVFWDQGVPPGQMPADASSLFHPRGYCYGVFRMFPWRYQIPILAQAKKILLVRDPRDAIVSHYFSVAKSHPEPKNAPEEVKLQRLAERERVGANTIDEHVLEHAEFFFRVHWRYMRDLTKTHTVRVFRYEDVIFEKRAWVDELCAELGWDVPARLRHEVADLYDKRPKEENAAAHIRRVTPGDHREKLRPETIEKLNEVFATALDRYGYER